MFLRCTTKRRGASTNATTGRPKQQLVKIPPNNKHLLSLSWDVHLSKLKLKDICCQCSASCGQGLLEGKEHAMEAVLIAMGQSLETYEIHFVDMAMAYPVALWDYEAVDTAMLTFVTHDFQPL